MIYKKSYSSTPGCIAHVVLISIGVFGIEVSAQAALEDGTVVAELVIQIPRVSRFCMQCNNHSLAGCSLHIHCSTLYPLYIYFTPLQDTALSPTYEVEYEPDSNTRSRNQVIFIKILSGLNNSRTPEGYQAYRIDGLDQDELYIMHIQEFITGTGVVQLSDQFFLCKYMQFSHTVCNKQNK